ncbi:hypothetical protein JCM8097_001289 [Rhodosporidiobolus ruineniae]
MSLLWLRKAGRNTLTIVQVLCGVHLFNEHMAEVRPCTGASMYPTLSHTGTFVLHSALALKLSPLERGNLVTAVSPLDPAHQVLKRVIGLPGDTVCVDPSGERRKPSVEWCKVPPGHVWLAGDNTSNSTDSRDYGPVPIALVRGKIVARVWPNPGLLENTTLHKADA